MQVDTTRRVVNGLPQDHPDRSVLAGEVHARPPEAIAVPSRASQIALLVAPEHRSREFTHVAALCESAGVTPPKGDAVHFAADFGRYRMKWERHGEFSTYTVFVPGASPTPFSAPAIALLPPEWTQDIPGLTLFAGHVEIIAEDAAPSPAALRAYFGDGSVVGAHVSGGDAMAFTDFRIHGDTFSRFLVVNRKLTASQTGRTVQRLFEIETYRMMALLALPLARSQAGPLSALEARLATLTEEIARQNTGDETLLQSLSELAVEVESRLALGQFRFGACKAYSDLVMRRISELREERLPGLQTIEDFMTRRFAPAVATAASIEVRLHRLSERIARTSALLSTRVEIARQQQSQMVLASLDRRARLQLRLQETVEIISVVPITYYVTALLGRLLHAVAGVDHRVDPDVIEGAAIPVVALLVILAMRRVHQKVIGDHRPGKEVV